MAEIETLRGKVKAQAYELERLRGELQALDKQYERVCEERRAEICRLYMKVDGMVEVVRCNECIFAHARVGRTYQCDITRLVSRGDFYCAYGERREADE